MLAAFENWFAKSGDFGARQLTVLRMLGLFDRPADTGCIAALRKPPVISGLTEPLFTARIDAGIGQATVQPLVDEDWNTAISFLGDFGLVAIEFAADDSEHFLDCHPLVREHFAKQIRDKKSDAWRSGHGRLFHYLSQSAPELPNTLSQMDLLYESMSHGCNAGRHLQVMTDVYWPRVCRGNEFFGTTKLGAFTSELAALATLFDVPWTRPNSSLPPELIAFSLNRAAHELRTIGRQNESLQPALTALDIRKSQQRWKDACTNAGIVNEVYLGLGNLREATKFAQQTVEFADLSGDWEHQADQRTTLADVLHQTGAYEASERWFRAGEAIQQHQQPQIPFLYFVPGYQFCDLLLTMGRFREVENRATRTLQIAEANERLLAIALDNLSLGRALMLRLRGKAMYDNNDRALGSQASKRFDTAVTGLRKSGELNYLSIGLLARADFWVWRADRAGAMADLDEAWQNAERGSMKLQMADVLLQQARLLRDLKNLAAAREIILNCGYGRRVEMLVQTETEAESW